MAADQPQQLSDKYLLLDRIGTGGMAEVHRCKMSGTMGFEKLIVIKKLLPQFAGDKEVVSQFISEARLAALLQHENIAYVYDFGEINGNYFIAMEYLFGKDLQSILQRAGEMALPLSAEQALFIATKICEGMEYAHALKDLHQRPLNIIHRDLSPHNIFITYDGKVKIIDFGIARAELFDNRTKAGMVKGKISYMSPEQLTDLQIDRRSDIFSIGILLYEMLAGKRMYSGDTATLIRKCMDVEYENLESLLPGLHPAIYRIVGKALAKNRDDRYESCAGMRTDLEECLFILAERPTAEILQTAILRLFAEEFEKERLLISAGAAEPFANNAATEAAVIDRTVVCEISGQDAPIAIQPPAASPPLKRPSRRLSWWAAIVAVGLGCLLVVFMVLRTGGNGEEGQKPAAESQPQGQVGGAPQVGISSPQSAPKGEAELKYQQEPQRDLSPPEEETGSRDATLQTLLSQADQAMNGHGAQKPDLQLSLDLFRQVLEREQDNPQALAGIRYIGEQYGVSAEQAMRAGHNSLAAAHLQKGLAIAPGNRRLVDLQARLDEERRESIRKLIGRAYDALQRDSLTTPADDCAYGYYQQVLRMDEKNSAATSGIARIADRYAELAEDAYRNMRISNAKEFVRQGLAIAPQHRQLRQLQRDLSRSKPGIFFKSIEKSIRPVFQQ